MCTAVISQMEEITHLTENNMKQVGLVDGHAYSLLGAKEIRLRSGQVQRLCLVRNPWGKKEWNGDWSDQSPLWDDYTMAQVQSFRNENDGCFWISFEDYDSYFFMTTICYFHTGFSEVNISDEINEEGFGVAKLTVPVATDQAVVISLY